MAAAMELGEEQISSTVLNTDFTALSLSNASSFLAQFPEASARIARVIADVFPVQQPHLQLYVLHLVYAVIQASIGTTNAFLDAFAGVVPRLAAVVAEAEDTGFVEAVEELWEGWRADGLFARSLMEDALQRCRARRANPAYRLEAPSKEAARRLAVKAIMNSTHASDVAGLFCFSDFASRVLAEKVEAVNNELKQSEQLQMCNPASVSALSAELEDLKKSFAAFVGVSCWKLGDLAQTVNTAKSSGE